MNELWFSSLAISLTSAFLATMFQKWTRRYISVTQPLGSPHKRARIRQFFLPAPATCSLFWRLTQYPPYYIFCPPLLCWPPYPAEKYQSYHLLCRGSVGRALRCGLHSNFPAGQPTLCAAYFVCMAILYRYTISCLQKSLGWSLVDVQLGFCVGAFLTSLYFAEMSI